MKSLMQRSKRTSFDHFVNAPQQRLGNAKAERRPGARSGLIPSDTQWAVRDLAHGNVEKAAVASRSR